MKGMWKCAKKGDTQEFVRLFNKGDSFFDIDTVNRTPLHYAAECGSIDIGRLILNQGGASSVDQRDNKGYTPLELAVQNGHEDFAVMLVTVGGAQIGSLQRKGAIPKRLEIRLREAELTRQSGGNANRGTLTREQAKEVKSAPPPIFDDPTPLLPSIDPSVEVGYSLPNLSLSSSSSSPSALQQGQPPRATPAPPSFGRSSRAPTSSELVPQQASRPSGTLRGDHSASNSIMNNANINNDVRLSESTRVVAVGGVVDLAVVISLVTRVVHAGMYEEFNALLLKEVNNATNQFATLPVPKDGLRVVSQNLREVGQFPVLGPMDVKRTKRVKEDYTAIYERIRPLQDALRVLELDRRAHAPALLHPPLLYLVGGVFSMFISIEQPYASHLDQVVNEISKSIRELSTGPPGKAKHAQLVASFTHFLRCVTVRLLEIRAPVSGYEVTHMVLAMSKAIKIDPSAAAAQLKIVVENLKNVMVVIKSTLPSRLGKELSPAEEASLYKEAENQLAQSLDAASRRAAQSEVGALERIAAAIPKLQSGFRSIRGTQNDRQKGGLGAAGRGLLGDGLQLTEASEALISSLPPSLSTVPSPHNNIGGEEECREAKLTALEVQYMASLMVELSIACVTLRNRSAHHSHIPLILVLLSVAVQWATFPL